MTEGASIAGIFTERDYARKIALMGRTSSVTQVRDVMTSAVRLCGPDQTSEQCMQIASTGRMRHLPVVDANDKLVGMISIGDLVKGHHPEQKFIIEQLEHTTSLERIKGTRGAPSPSLNGLCHSGKGTHPSAAGGYARVHWSGIARVLRPCAEDTKRWGSDRSGQSPLLWVGWAAAAPPLRRLFDVPLAGTRKSITALR